MVPARRLFEEVVREKMMSYQEERKQGFRTGDVVAFSGKGRGRLIKAFTKSDVSGAVLWPERRCSSRARR